MTRPQLSTIIRPPLRIRIAIASSASIAVILVTLSLFIYGRMHVELVRALDAGLQARASAVAASIGQFGPAIPDGPDGRPAAITAILSPGGCWLGRALRSPGCRYEPCAG